MYMLRLQDLPEGAIVQLYYRGYEQGYGYSKPMFRTYIISFNDNTIFFSNVESKYEDNFGFYLNQKAQYMHFDPTDINNLNNFGFDKKYIIVYGIYIFLNSNNKKKVSYSMKGKYKMNIYNTKCIYQEDISEIAEDEIQTYNNRYKYY